MQRRDAASIMASTGLGWIYYIETNLSTNLVWVYRIHEVERHGRTTRATK
jgi:hypothetical protein